MKTDTEQLIETQLQKDLSTFYVHFPLTKLNVEDTYITYNVSPFDNGFALNLASETIKEHNLKLKARLHGTGIFKNNKLTIEAI